MSDCSNIKLLENKNKHIRNNLITLETYNLNTITALLNIWDQKAANGLSRWTKQVIHFGPFNPGIVKINKINQQHHLKK